MYRSRLIAHKLRIEAVEQLMSEEIQMLQKTGPNNHLLRMSFTTANVITSKATSRSAIARDTMKA